MQADDLIGQSGGDLSPQEAARVLDMVLYPDDYMGQSENVAGDSPAPPESGQPQEAAANAEATDPEPDKGTDTEQGAGGQPRAEQTDTPQPKQTDIDALVAQRLADSQTGSETPKNPQPDTLQALAENSGLSDDELRELFGDFSEKSMVSAISKLVDLAADKRLSAFEERIAARLAPIESKQQQDAMSGHYRAIYAAHPDADTLVAGEAWQAWLQSQPHFARTAVENVLANGSTQDVIDVFSQFKAAQQPKEQPAQKPQEAAKAENTAAKQPETPKQPEPQAVPDTLSGFPAARAGAVPQDEQLSGLGSVQLADRLSEMPPEQIEQFLNSR